jgi:hypothetical protein
LEKEDDKKQKEYLERDKVGNRKRKKKGGERGQK